VPSRTAALALPGVFGTPIRDLPTPRALTSFRAVVDLLANRTIPSGRTLARSSTRAADDGSGRPFAIPAPFNAHAEKGDTMRRAVMWLQRSGSRVPTLLSGFSISSPTMPRRRLDPNLMKRLLTFAVVLACASATVVGQPATKPAIYMAPTDDGFEVYVAAAIVKKGVPVRVVDRPDMATYTLKSAQIDIHKETTGAKVVKCLFAYCADIQDKASTSVQLTDQDGAVLWSYSVNKGRGQKNKQSLAEAIAKHMKDDYFHK
jgi:hypothetical protein